MPDAAPLRPGDPARLGAYDLLGFLGEGGQGAVFLGRPAGAVPGGEYVAIKLLHAGLSADSPARLRFARELEVAKRVARFCTAQVLDAEVAGEQPYIVSEYVQGPSLHSAVTGEGPRTGGALERLAMGTLTALTAIHQAGIMHRDFKPHNILLGSDGPRVIDFGIARALDAAGETQTIGTPAYMAPEQFAARGFGPPADLFAWGSTMVFAASGRPAFGNDDTATVMHRIIYAHPDLGDLPSPLREVVAAVLAKGPEQRPTARDAQQWLLGGGRAERLASAGSPAIPADAFTGTPHQTPMHDLGTAAPVKPPVTRADEGTSPRRPGRTALLAAGLSVAALLGGGAAWAAARGQQRATGRGSDAAAPSGGKETSGRTPSRSAAGAQVSGTGTKDPARQATGPATTPDAAAGLRQAGRRRPGTPGRPGSSPDGHHGGTTARSNPYTSQRVCDSGGHGGGYYVQRSSSFAGGEVFQLYNDSGYNCVVTVKTTGVGQKSGVWAEVTRKDGTKAADRGSYTYYAGPVFLYAKGQCVKYAGGTGRASASGPWGNCG
jgi:predicted Ser/Thr protein kinase